MEKYNEMSLEDKQKLKGHAIANQIYDTLQGHDLKHKLMSLARSQKYDDIRNIILLQIGRETEDRIKGRFDYILKLLPLH